MQINTYHISTTFLKSNQIFRNTLSLKLILYYITFIIKRNRYQKNMNRIIKIILH